MSALLESLSAARSAIVRGEAERALTEIDRFADAVERAPPEDDDIRKQIGNALAELQTLARAAMEGAESATEQIKEIVRSARTFQTYDGTGQRRVTRTTARMPRRF